MTSIFYPIKKVYMTNVFCPLKRLERCIDKTIADVLAKSPACGIVLVIAAAATLLVALLFFLTVLLFLPLSYFMGWI